ncbi:MAG: hypothetical protein QG594_1909 [Bacteroidota bacterium]|nr:hypothetical protein [Bacteroidota bacterium]
MKKQKIEDIFSSIENYSSVPPPELWTKIEEELDKPKKKKKVILWWSAAACLLLGLLLPSVFNSNSGIEKMNNGWIEKSVVLDENKNKLNNNSKTRSVDNNREVKSGTVENPVLENIENPSDNTPKNKTYKTTITHTESKNNINSSASNQNLNIGTEDTNQSVAEKTYVTGKQNSFNSLSNNQIPAEKRNENQTIAEKAFVAGKQNSFNSFSNNQVPNSIFEDKLNSKNNAAVALNGSSSISDEKQSTQKENETITSKSMLADNTQKNNSISANSLSRQDSVQLAELQNLEKGIVEGKPEKDKEIKSDPNSEKWSLEVFAGIANSENYNNQKTLGSVNESKQTNSYGVKTNYKLNKKWAVSSGLKINELGQSIANVSYYSNQSLSSAPIMNDYFSPNSFVSGVTPKITDNSSYVFVSKNTRNALKSDNLESGNIDQSLKYIEMPLEVSYALFNKNKTSISLNTGGFVGKLISNNVTLNGNSIGDNLNASDFVYGTLLSSTLQYRLYKKTHVFVEPGMNYYVNPVSNQTFNQFQWAFYFGLNV